MKRDKRIDELYKIAQSYVLDGLGGKNFDAIPYHEGISVRAPLNPGVSEQPIVGKENLLKTW